MTAALMLRRPRAVLSEMVGTMRPFAVQPSPRVKFIASHGLVPWGVLAGVVAAVIGAFGVRHGVQPEAASTGTIVLVAFGCFTIWALFVGWGVGALLWATRDRNATRDRPSPPHGNGTG